MTKIGYQDGITAFNNWFRAMDKWQEEFEKWAKLPNEQRAITQPPIPPAIQSRGPGYNVNDLSTWPWPDKHERTERILKDAHDAAVGPVDPEEPPDPEPEVKKYAPQAYNKGAGGQNARYNVKINCVQLSSGNYSDGEGVIYDDGGRQTGNLRSEKDVSGLKAADMMDGKDPWEPYEWQGTTFPPYPPASYER